MKTLVVRQFVVCDSVDLESIPYFGRPVSVRTRPGEVRSRIDAMVRVAGMTEPEEFSLCVYFEDLAGQLVLLKQGEVNRIEPPTDGTEREFVVSAGPIKMGGEGRYLFVLICGDHMVAERDYVFGFAE